ncbi:hypothetical protein FY528_08720 [Hymenobacter lutimineralis]|uniref:DUF7033 domain-containing protein n=1 Tax=Hymenobacter lutimineralis TaxID=2606448 RepID=A0A5D6V5F9_9BACT|nr:hypothetical protein [Hymenobacter lutimineralis]TYZ10540.1 hypothetical protein FY528_08720 [Hymenobacter lutimineralis]
MEIDTLYGRAIPEAAASGVSRASQTRYVLQHFWQCYPGPEALRTSVEGQMGKQLQIEDHAQGFFDDVAPFPPEPTWHEWLGQRIPFFFTSEGPLLELLPEQKVLVRADLISAAFYLLSGWQEYFSAERDQHGRFPYMASVQQRYGFVAVPVVNYYFDVLRKAIEHVTGQLLHPRCWAGNAQWAAFITHDIDSLHSAWKAPAKAALRQGRLLSFGRQFWRHFKEKDTWDNLAEVQQTVAGYGAKSTFFILPENEKAANGTPNADYQLTTIQAQWPALQAAGAEAAVHASIGTARNLSQLQTEAAAVGKATVPPLGLRFHYLCWEPRSTPQLVQQAGFSYDSTLGFAEHFGFRNSFCQPFYPFNFQTGAACDFLEIPLNVMDATLYHPRYLQLKPAEVLPALLPMLTEIVRFGGVCTVLWHNENFDPVNHHNGPREFHALMKYLRSRNASFVNGRDICEWM